MISPAVHTEPDVRPLQIAVITGLSGAGRSTAAKCLEDLGWFVVDNLPPGLIAPMVDLGRRTQGAVSRIACVVDVRSRAFTSDLRTAIAELDRKGCHPRIVFLEATDDVLVRRFDGVRRPHPLQGDGRLVDGITTERELLRELRGDADIVIDTSVLNVHELRAKVAASFGDTEAAALQFTIVSFGYKYGLPVDADLVADCRFLPNPHWVPELREHSGLEDTVRAYVLEQPAATDFLDRYDELLRVVSTGYRTEGKRYVTLAVGCTGGKHRSVVMAEELAKRLRAADPTGVEVTVVHRDLGRE
ncbi:MAG: RNase adapter RapZ [Actinomycetes bacterium]